jgi:hypothetical protein
MKVKNWQGSVVCSYTPHIPYNFSMILLAAQIQLYEKEIRGYRTMAAVNNTGETKIPRPSTTHKFNLREEMQLSGNVGLYKALRVSVLFISMALI